jgi:EmrB/QacA subfamily drug resistance transporter
MSNSGICDPPARPLRWLVLALIGVGTFMTTLDISIVNVALPVLTREFNTNVGTSQWFVLAYTFVITVLLMTFGKLGDIYGRKSLYQWGVFMFSVGSLLCALSVSALMLIVSRAVQGLGSAIIMSSGPAMVTEGFPAAERGKALGLVGTAVALGLLAGPVMGGALLQYASWQWMFLINLPAGALLIGLMAAKVQGFDARGNGGLDIPGAALMAISLAAVVFGLSFGGGLGWASGGTIALFVSGAVLAAAFVVVERRVENPMLNLSLFRIRSFSIGTVTGWANYAAIMPVSVFMPFYLANILGYSPGMVGVTLAFGPLTLAIISPIAGALSDRIGYKSLTVIGQLLLALGILSLRSLTPDSSWIDVIWRLVLASFGSGLFVSPNSSAIMGAVDCRYLGVASGIVALVRNLGMVSGIAVAGAIITSISPTFTLEGLRAAFIASAAVAAFGAVVSFLRIKL